MDEHHGEFGPVPQSADSDGTVFVHSAFSIWPMLGRAISQITLRPNKPASGFQGGFHAC
jgi:hypothetical protein